MIRVIPLLLPLLAVLLGPATVVDGPLPEAEEEVQREQASRTDHPPGPRDERPHTLAVAENQTRLLGGAWLLRGLRGDPIEGELSLREPAGDSGNRLEFHFLDATTREKLVFIGYWFGRGGEVRYEMRFEGHHESNVLYQSSPGDIFSFSRRFDLQALGIQDGDIMLVFAHSTERTDMTMTIRNLTADSVRLDERTVTAAWPEMRNGSRLDLSGLLLDVSSMHLRYAFQTTGCSYGAVGAYVWNLPIAAEENLTLYGPLEGMTPTWLGQPGFDVSVAPAAEWDFSFDWTGVSDVRPTSYVALLDGLCPDDV